MQPIAISPEQEAADSVSGSSSRVSSARSLVSSMWAGSEEPDYDAFARARKVNLYGQVRREMWKHFVASSPINSASAVLF